MLGTFLVYRESRARAKAHLQSKNRPTWLRAFAALRVANEGQSSDETFAVVEQVSSELSRVRSKEAATGSSKEAAVDAEIASMFPQYLKRSSNDDADDAAPNETVDPTSRSCQNSFALSVRAAITQQPWFEGLVVLAVLMVAVVTAMELEHDDHTEVEEFIDTVSLAIFVFEAVAKILAEGDDPLAYFRSPYRDIITGQPSAERGGLPNYMNIFDFSILIVGITTSVLEHGGTHDLLHDYANIKLVKLIRIFRLFSVARKLESLRLVMMGLLQGMRSSFYIVLLLILIIYMFAVLAVRLFGANDPGNFGKLSVAMLSLFQIANTESWSSFAYTAMFGCDTFLGGEGFYDGGVVPEEDLQPNPNKGVVHKYKLTFEDTKFGKYPLWECTEPEAALGRGWTELFFVVFICITAFVVMGLFIGAITMAMLSAITEMNMEKEVGDYDNSASSMSLALAPNGTLARTMDLLMSDEADKSLGKAMRSAISDLRSDNEEGRGTSLSRSPSMMRDAALLDTLETDAAKSPTARRSQSAPSSSSSATSSPSPSFVCSSFISACFAIEQHPFFGNLVTTVILIVAVLIGVETDNGDLGPTVKVFNYIFLGVFILEVVIKTGANAILPGTTLSQAFLRYLKDPWNKFDFFIVVVGILEVLQPLLGVGGVDGLMALRLLRMLRIFRAAKGLPRLRALIDALTSGASTAFVVMILFAILNFILACIGVLEFSKNDPFHFGDLSTALFSIWRVESKDGAFAMMKINTYGCHHFGYEFLAESGKDGFANHTHKMCSERGYNGHSVDNEQAMGAISTIYFLFAIILGGKVLPATFVGIVAIQFEKSWTKFRGDEVTARLVQSMVKRMQEQDTPGSSSGSGGADGGEQEAPRSSLAFLDDDGGDNFIGETKKGRWWGPKRIGLVRKVFAALDQDASGSLGVGEAEFFIQYVLVRYLAGVTQTLPQGTMSSDNDNQDDSIDPEDATRLRATDWRSEGVEIDNEDHDGGASTPALKVGDSGAVGEILTALVKDVFMTVDSSGDAILNVTELMSFVILIKHVQRGFQGRRLLPTTKNESRSLSLVALEAQDLESIRTRLSWLVSGGKASSSSSSKKRGINNSAITVTDVQEVSSPEKSRTPRFKDPVQAAATRLQVQPDELNDILARLTLADFRRLKQSATSKSAAGRGQQRQPTKQPSRSRNSPKKVKAAAATDGGIDGTTL